MKKFWLLSLLLITTASLLPSVVHGQKGKFRKSENGVANRYIVVLNPKYVSANAAEPAINSEAGYLTAVYGGSVKKTYAHAVQGFAIEMTEQQALRLSKDDRVSMVEQDSYTYAEGVQSSATWGLDRIDQRALPFDSSYSYSTDASNVHAYIIDSGIRTTHVEFGGRATNDFDAVGDGQNGNDCLGHGTHVAGTVGAATWGVAKGIRLHSVRVLPCTNSGTLTDLIEGVDWVKANHLSPAVANISITASGVSSTLDNAVQNLVNSGVTVVVAAGNSNVDACGSSPARAAKAITVGAFYNADLKAAYSNYGSCLDIWAPGTGITSVSYANDFDSRIMSGTSMASPHVAGVAALYLASSPTASAATVTQAIVDSATTGMISNLDAASPNKMVYSWFNSAPPAPTISPARVTIKKRANSRTEAISSTAFPYEATKLASNNFTLQPNNQFEDLNVTQFGSSNVITVTEAQVFGWALSSISCVETSGGSPNVLNTTVDLVNRKANIVVEPGEQVVCTFTSDEIAPTAANADVSGRVTTSSGKAVKGVRMTLMDTTTGQVYEAYTTSFGYFKFVDKPAGHQYTLTAIGTRQNPIANNVRTFTLNSDLALADFVAGR